MNKYIINKENKLSWSGVIALIPHYFKPFSEFKRLRRSLCVLSIKGWIAIYASRYYPGESDWFVKPFTRDRDPDIMFWVFALDVRGILIVPTYIIEEFCVNNSIPQTPSCQWKLWIKESDGKYYLFSKCSLSLYDVTDCFIPSTKILPELNDVKSLS